MGRPQSADPAKAAERKRLLDLERTRERTRRGADIGEIPKVVDAARRESCRLDLERFLVTYFPYSTGLSPFSDDHKRVISRIQDCVTRGGRFVNAVYRGFAKALDLDTPIPTPSGFVEMRDIHAGDIVFDDRGEQCRVVAETPVFTDADCYRVEFDDGESIVCSGDHLWTVRDGGVRGDSEKTVNTRELVSAKVPGNRTHRFAVCVAKECRIDTAVEHIIDPYVLGFWLGDGHSAANRVTIGRQDQEESVRFLVSAGETVNQTGEMLFTVGKGRSGTTKKVSSALAAVEMLAAGFSLQEVADKCEMTLPAVRCIKQLGRWVGAPAKPSLICRLREIGVLNNKHIPESYLNAPAADRWSLLQGLMDTDGTCSKKGYCSYTTKLPVLRDGIRRLLWSLGIKNTTRIMVVNGMPYHMVCFTCHSDRPCFRLSRKANRQRPRPAGKAISDTRRIVSVRPVQSRPVKCIEVDSPSRLYLCGKSFVPTHNSTISELALLWAMLYGHKRFGGIFAAESDLAAKAINSIRTELSDNDLLYQDFPEVCHAVRALEGKAQRCNSQTHNGRRTHIGWKKDTLVLPTIEGSVSSGAIIMSRGLTGSILGLRWKTPEGHQLRPDFTIVDDPQTRESARSPVQCQARLEILTKSVMKLAGHTKSMACVVNATVIEQDDMVDQLLDQGRYPAWQGERIPMVRQFADRHEDLWMERYRELRCTFAKDVVGDQARAHREANEFYAANRDEMDRGCLVSWESCFDPDVEVSAIQHAYNALIDDGPDVFASEFQQAPLKNAAESLGISPDEVRGRAIEIPVGVVPRGCDTLTAFVDVQEKLLYWAVVAWGSQLRGHLVAYGAYPEQGRSYYTLRDAKKTLVKAAGGASLEAAIHAGLEAVAASILGREFTREDDDAVLRVGQLFVDANWAQTQGVVRDFARRSSFGPRVLPTHGRFVGASGQTISDKRPDRGERIGHNWRTSTIGKQRHVLYDTNAWKTFVASRLKLPAADPQAFTVHAGSHEMLVEHLSAEAPVRVESKMRTVDEWKLIPGRDNHWWDCLVGAAVAASYSGVTAVGAEVVKPVRKVITREEMAARRAAIMGKMGR